MRKKTATHLILSYLWDKKANSKYFLVNYLRKASSCHFWFLFLKEAVIIM